MRTVRRHKQAVKEALAAGTLTLEPGPNHIESVEDEVARRRALTDSGRGVWGQAGRQKLHVTREAGRVIDEVGRRFVDELDRRLPAPSDDIEKMREEKRRLETAIRKANENKRMQRAAEKAKAEEARANGPGRRKRPRVEESCATPCVG